MYFPTSKDDGRISEEMFKEFLFEEDGENVITCIGGPPLFVKAAHDYLKDLGYSKKLLVKFF